MPMLCIPKKNGTLCTIFSLWQQNENTWKDVTPFPDQDMIHHDIVWAKFRSKLDIVGLYRNVKIFWLGSFSRKNKSKEVNLIIYPLSDCQALYIVQVSHYLSTFFISKIIIENKRELTPSGTVKHWGEAGIGQFNMHLPCSCAWDTMISYTALISTPDMVHGKVLANPASNGIKWKCHLE